MRQRFWRTAGRLCDWRIARARAANRRWHGVLGDVNAREDIASMRDG